MEHLVVPTFVLDPDGRVMIWNKACERLTQVAADEVVGTRDHWSAFYEEPRACLADLIVENRTDEIDELYATSSIQKDIYDGIRAENWATMPKAGNTLYLAINSGPIFDDGGELIAVVETLRDMTEQKKAEEALQSLAHKDGLTGLANRRSFDISLEADLLHAVRENHSVSLLLCDVDHFKAYNDTYGHHDGDVCLKKVAKAVGGHILRATDLAARYGGEEFAIILPTSDLEGAFRVAERVRQSIFDLNVEHSSSATSDRITASLGVAAVIPKPGFKPSELIEMADQALYKAKEGGRNRVVTYSEVVGKT
jgi:diguanylate cyclase (GGDEF)-like protein/PAS domain S-box-containing protein